MVRRAKLIVESSRTSTSRGKLFWEQRRETRYTTNDPARVATLPPTTDPMSGTVVDVSKSGMRLEVPTALAKGCRVEVVIPGKITVYGEVRYCRKSGAVFQAGVLIEGTLSEDTVSRGHLHEDEISLYVAGTGLTVPEVLRAKEHLATCESCSGLMRAVAARLYPDIERSE